MLQRLSGQITACLERAADADCRAETLADPVQRRDYREMAKSWRHLAASYQFVESLERFILDKERAKNTPPEPPAPPD